MTLRRFFLLFAGLLLSNSAVKSQQLQAGLAGWPGFGVYAVYIDVHTVYTVETMAYTELDPFDARNTLRVGVAAGAALLPLNIWRVIGQADYGYDIDLGIRFGPSLVFVEDATRDDKNQQFSLFLDPFIRFRTGLGQSSRSFFVELGTTRPVVRTGFWFSL